MSGRILKNSEIAELLASQAESVRQPVQKAMRRVARRAFLWPEEAARLVKQNRLTELPGVGPYLSKVIRKWFEQPPRSEPAPGIRADFLTITEARLLLSKNQQWSAQIKGDLQTHSVWSDGSGSIQEMAEAAAERGYKYLAITDHSKGLKIAGGIDEQQLRKQGEEIEVVNASFRSNKMPFRLLRSIELNLSPEGRGDMDEYALQSLDLVLGCFHSALRRKEDQTERYLAALRNPSVHILGHPRGRIYNFRGGLNADWGRVFGLAAELDKAVEIDCYPDRQDLNVGLLRVAKKAGCRISIGTDSHAPSQLAFMDLGVAAVLLARINPDRILNLMDRVDLIAWASSLARR